MLSSSAARLMGDRRVSHRGSAAAAAGGGPPWPGTNRAPRAGQRAAATSLCLRPPPGSLSERACCTAVFTCSSARNVPDNRPAAIAFTAERPIDSNAVSKGPTRNTPRAVGGGWHAAGAGWIGATQTVTPPVPRMHGTATVSSQIGAYSCNPAARGAPGGVAGTHSSGVAGGAPGGGGGSSSTAPPGST